MNSGQNSENPALELWQLRDQSHGELFSYSDEAKAKINAAFLEGPGRTCAAALIVSDDIGPFRKDAAEEIVSKILAQEQFDPITEMLVVEALQFFPTNFLNRSEPIDLLRSVAKRGSIASNAAQALLNQIVG